MNGRRFLTKRSGAIAIGTLLVLFVLNYKKGNFESIKGIDWTQLQLEPKWADNDISSSAKRPTKIVFWIPPNSSVKIKIERQTATMDIVNQDQNSICRDVDLPEFSNLNPCHFSLARRNVTNADSVVLWMFESGFKVPELPAMEHAKGAIRVAFIREPPPHGHWKDPLKGQVNWTMSYRKDSDVWTPYGKTVKLSKPLKRVSIGNYSLDAWMSLKKKLVAGVISNCRTASKREKLIKEMNDTGIAAVDIFGGCGKPFKCGRHAKNCESSWELFGLEYKFFLAFENSICEDYITEKLWRTLEIGMVPVVYGGGNYKTDLPPKSFINVMDFNSSLSLMTYLKSVGDNKTEYAKYFEWKKTHEVINNLLIEWCSLCREVQKALTCPKVKVYANLKTWWQHKSYNTSIPVCTKPPKTLFS